MFSNLILYLSIELFEINQVLYLLLRWLYQIRMNKNEHM